MSKPDYVSQWAWDEAMKARYGTTDFDVIMPRNREGVARIARAFQSAHARGVAEGKAEQREEDVKTVAELQGTPNSAWNEALDAAVSSIRQQPKGESHE